MVISPKHIFLVSTGVPVPGSAGAPQRRPCQGVWTRLLPQRLQSRADAQLSIEHSSRGDDSLRDYVIAQMNMEGREKLLSLRKQINLQKGQVTINPCAWKKKGSGKLKRLWWRGCNKKLLKILFPGASALCVPMLWGTEILGPFAWQEEEEADRKAAMFTRRCISRLVYQICFAYTFSHRQKEVIRPPVSVVKITSRFIPRSCTKHVSDLNPTVTPTWTHVGTHTLLHTETSHLWHLITSENGPLCFIWA